MVDTDPMDNKRCIIPFMPGMENVAFAIIFFLLLSSFSLLGSASDDLQISKPIYSIGSGDDNWWIEYPDSSNVSAPVNHLPWILESLEGNPVVILCRSKVCPTCEEQKKRLEKVLENYGNNVTYYDLVAEDDIRTYDAMEVYYWAPIVPVTIVLTLVRDADDKIAVGWHTMNSAIEEEIIASYIRDAIFYHQVNSMDWDKQSA